MVASVLCIQVNRLSSGREPGNRKAKRRQMPPRCHLRRERSRNNSGKLGAEEADEKAVGAAWVPVRCRSNDLTMAARLAQTPPRWQRRRGCMSCRCMPNPPLATGNRTRHVCAADNPMQTRCKQQAPRVIPSNNSRKPCRNWENARPQRLQKMPFGAPNTPIDQLCGRV